MNEYYWANRGRILARVGEAARAEKYVARVPLDLPLRDQEFWARVAVGGPQECWPWKGGLTEKGYGAITVKGKRRRAHQVAWEMVHDRPVPDGQVIMHTCDTPACCNPMHLRSGTDADNIADATTKARRIGLRAGEKHPRARLTKKLVAEIRARIAALPELSWRLKGEIGADYGITAAHVHNIIKGRYWKD